MRCRITGLNSQYLSVTLNDILNAEILAFKDLSWRILSLEAIMSENFGLDIRELETYVNKSKNGIEISFSYLHKFSEEMFQGINILLVGDSDSSKLRRYVDAQEMYNKCKVVIELFDGDCWEISLKEGVSPFIAQLPGFQELNEP